MPRANDVVERLLLEYAELLSIVSEDRFKARAYEKAARAVGGFSTDVDGLDVKGMMRIPSVGRSIAEKVDTYLRSGSFPELEELRAKIPAGVRELMAIPGMGPKKAVTLYDHLGIDSVEALTAAVDRDEIAALKGFGAKTQDNIRKGLQQVRSSTGRVQLPVAFDVAERLLAELSAMRGVRRAAFAGSLRRMVETIGDVDLLVASRDAAPIMEAFVSAPGVSRVLAHGDRKSSILDERGLQVDLRVVPIEAWGAAMIYFTGSKAHNVRIREIAVRKGLKLNEYGLFVAESGELLAAETEEAVYERLGMTFIPPTLREDRGEVQAALDGSLPSVIQQRQIRGDLHTHTNLTDGLAPLDEMVAAGAAAGYAYYAVTDHAPNLFMQRMTEDKMLAQRERVRALQRRYPKMTLLHGTELNIDPDGGVDWDDEFLAGFDVTVASVHSHWNLPREQQTRRIVRAMENSRVHVIGHLTGRRIGSRPPLDLDVDEVFAAAARTGTALEINSHPDRLDLRDEHVIRARRHGVRFAVDTDAHAPVHLPNLRFGVGTAQRGGVTKDDVINAWPLARLRRFLADKAR